MYRIEKQFHFSASHVLEGLPEGHPCGRLHGHNYVLTVVLEAEGLDATGFVRDFGDLHVVKDLVDVKLDHRHLNEVLPQPSSENLARWVYDYLVVYFPDLAEVRVSETPKTWASYRPGGVT